MNALITLQERYPAESNLALLYSYACIYGDGNYYRSLTELFDVQTSRLWLRQVTREDCDAHYLADDAAAEESSS